MPKTRAFSRKSVPGYGDSRYRAPVMEQAPVTKSYEEQKSEEARAYLESERKVAPGRYTYLQTVLGEINGGRLAWSDLRIDELQALLAEEAGFKQAAIAMGDDAEVAKVQAVMNAAMAELQRQGGSWFEPAPPERAPLTVPPAEHPQGR